MEERRWEGLVGEVWRFGGLGGGGLLPLGVGSAFKESTGGW